MPKISVRTLTTVSFMTILFAVMVLSNYKSIVIALTEFGAELWLMVELIFFVFQAKKNKNFEWSTVAFFTSVFFLFFADSLYNAHIVKITDNYAFLSDCFYSVFSLFLLVFLIKKLNIFEREFKEWGWFFLSIFVVDAFLSYRFLLSPYLLTNVALAWKINGSIYMALTVVIFSLILPFAFKVPDRKTFWFLNLFILLFTADFAIRYQDAFIDNAKFSWAEIGWCFSVIGLACLMRFSRGKKDLFVLQPLILAPFVSIKSLLTLSICWVNILLLIGIFSIKLFSVNNAIDIASVLLLLFLLWTIANEFSIWLANDLRQTLKHMFKIKENLSADGIVQFNLEKVKSKNYIFEISKILESFNDLAIRTNKMMHVVTETNKKITMAEVASQVSHDIRSPLAALDMAVKELPELREESRIIIRSSIGRIKDITNNLLQKNPKNFSADITPVKFIASNEVKNVQLLSSLIDRLISEKRMQFREKIGIEIDSTVDESAYGIFSKVNTREFMRMLSNLINNAVEAVGDSGRVSVSLSQFENYAMISIVDNGCGIPSEILSNLGKRGETFGKEFGSGLGLYHARTTVESWNGFLEIHSTPPTGTTVKVMLPLVKAPAWFVDNLHISANSIIVVGSFEKQVGNPLSI